MTTVYETAEAGAWDEKIGDIVREQVDASVKKTEEQAQADVPERTIH